MNFTKSTSMLIVATVFGLWLSVYFSERLEAILSYVLILSFGVLHGANDIDLMGQYLKSKKLKVTKIQLVIIYVLFVLVVWRLFYLVPVSALIGFILISSYHFGEQHWSKRVDFNPVLSRAYFFLYGGFILFMIFYINIEQVNEIILQISGLKVPDGLYGYLLFALGLLLAMLWGVGSILGRIHQSIVFELFLLGVFFVIFNTASLLLGFCIYFVIWHSVPSLMDQMRFLYGEITWPAFFSYFKKSFVYWLVSLVGIFGIYSLLGSESSFLVSGLICFLAAITFPHVLVMSRIENQLKTDPKTDIGSEP